MAFEYRNHSFGSSLFLPCSLSTSAASLPSLDFVSVPLPPFGSPPSVSSFLHILSHFHFPASFFSTSPLLFILSLSVPGCFSLSFMLCYSSSHSSPQAQRSAWVRPLRCGPHLTFTLASRDIFTPG